MSLAIDKQDNQNVAMPEIVISNVPEDVHATLLERAAKLNVTLGEFLLRVISEEAEWMTWDEIFNKMAPFQTSNFSHGDLMRAIDESRDEH
jgi:hypothetical protein